MRGYLDCLKTSLRIKGSRATLIPSLAHRLSFPGHILAVSCRPSHGSHPTTLESIVGYRAGTSLVFMGSAKGTDLEGGTNKCDRYSGDSVRVRKHTRSKRPLVRRKESG